MVEQSSAKKRKPWYIGGLHFDCAQCGRCCSGPEEGYIWLTKKEAAFISDYLKITPQQLSDRYLKSIGSRTTIIEDKATRDCIFLQKISGQKCCLIYHVRPNQCRTWPFWSSNLESPDTWNYAARVCAGINRGRLYSFEEIEEIRKSSKWWEDDKSPANSKKN